MGKRKAPSTGDDLVKITTASGHASGEDTDVAAKMKEHREYLLAQVGLTPDDVDTPPPKKRKTAAKNTTKDDDVDVQTDFTMVPGPTEVKSAPAQPENNLSMPEAAWPSKNTKSKSKTKSKKSKTIKTDPAGLSSAANTAANSDVDGVCLKSKLEDLPESQKLTQRTKPAKAKRRITSSVVKDKATVDTNPVPNLAPLSASLQAKIRQVHDFISNGHLSNPTFLPSKPREKTQNIIELPTRTLTGVLKRLYIDYELGDQEKAHLAELEMCITDRFTTDVKDCPDQAWIRLDLGLVGEVEVLETVKRKVRVSGLDGVNVLEVEVAMMQRDLLTRHGMLHDGERSVFSAPKELQAMFDKTLDDVRARDAATNVSASVPEVTEADTHLEDVATNGYVIGDDAHVETVAADAGISEVHVHAETVAAE